MKTSEAFQIWTKCVGNKWEGNRVPLDERKLDCTLTKEPRNYITTLLCAIGLPCSKLNNSKLIKDTNKIFAVSKRYINIFSYKMNKSVHSHLKIYQTILVS